MNTEHVSRWTQELRTTTIPQIAGQLAGGTVEAGTTVGACCLGILEHVRLGVRIEEIPDSALPARESAAWLGVEEGGTRRQGSKVNFVLDFPYVVRHCEVDDEPFENFEMSTTAMNDDLRLTFEQIADMVDYFGIKHAEVFA